MSTSDPLTYLRGFGRFVYLTKKIAIYFFRYARHPRYLFLYLTRSLDSNYHEKIHFIDNQSFLNLARKRSTIRFGDGEFGMLIDKRGIYFQEADHQLISGLKAIITEYSDSSPYLLGINPHILIPNQALAKHNLKFAYMQQKIGYFLYGDKESRYFNASIFYLNGWARLFLQQVSTNKNVIVVSNKKSLAAVLNDSIFTKAKNVISIETPEINAFSAYGEIMNKIRNNTNEDTVVLLSAGPAGKVMVHELAKEGILAHDIGHGLKFAPEEIDQERLAYWDMVRPYFEQAI